MAFDVKRKPVPSGFTTCKFQFIDAANRRKFTITNDKLQMNGIGFAHDFNYFRRKYLNL